MPKKTTIVASLPPASASAQLAACTVELIPLTQIAESAFNPRRTFSDIKELAEDIQKRGILQPILVRPISGVGITHQVVFGARRLRAAQDAGLKAIPAMVRMMTDLEALEAAIVENSKRADVHPLEEADGYRALRDQHNFTAEEIAIKVGKSKAYLYARLKLCELGEEARAAFLEDKFSASIALLIARIPSHKLQMKATNEITSSRQWDGPWSYREAARHLQQHYMTDLEHAPFDTKDAELVPAAGACGPCPKRSGNSPDLFGDVEGADVCSDPICFRGKVEADAAAKIKAAESKGTKVLEGEEAAKALKYNSSYVKLEDKCYEDPKHRTYAQLLKKTTDLDRVVAIAGDGVATELADAKDVTAALTEAGHEWAKKVKSPATDSYAKGQRDRQKAAKVRSVAVVQALQQLPEVITGLATRDPVKFWRFLAGLTLADADADVIDLVGKVYFEEEPKKDRESTKRALTKQITVLDEDGACTLVVQLHAAKHASGGAWSSTYGTAIRTVCDFADVNLKEIEKGIKDAAKKPDPKLVHRTILRGPRSRKAKAADA